MCEGKRLLAVYEGLGVECGATPIGQRQNSLGKMAGTTGLEPATSCVTAGVLTRRGREVRYFYTNECSVQILPPFFIRLKNAWTSRRSCNAELYRRPASDNCILSNSAWVAVGYSRYLNVFRITVLLDSRCIS
jgi:hypothetical protein